MKKIRPIYFAAIVTLLAAFFVFEALFCKNLSYHFPFVGYGGTFKHTQLKIIGIPIYWFMMLCGFLITFALSWDRRGRYQLSPAVGLISPILFLLICYAGAKLLYILETYRRRGCISLGLDGVSLYGAIFLLLPAVPAIALCARKEIPAMYDFFAPFGIILLACVRMGCFFNDCCGAITLWNGINPIILPVQLMEVICDLLILEFCFHVERKYPGRGFVYPTFMLNYSICRFFLEFLRDTPKENLFLTNGQLYSLIAIGVSVIFFAVLKKGRSLFCRHILHLKNMLS